MSERKFSTGKEFEETFKRYLSKCTIEEKLPNIAGFCVFCDMNRDTFYAQKEYYSDTFKKINEMLEDETINAKNINDTFKIFYMKNKFDYKDKKDVDANVATEIKVTLDD